MNATEITLRPLQAMQTAIDTMETLLMLDATHSVSMSEGGKVKTRAAIKTLEWMRS